MCSGALTGQPNGKCALRKVGAPCPNDDGTLCASGKCVDGVCCEAPCNGLCEACSAARKGQGADGVCGPVAKGTNPDKECMPGGVLGCELPGTCDGAGKCASKAGASMRHCRSVHVAFRHPAARRV